MINKPLFYLVAFITALCSSMNLFSQSCNCLPGWQYKLTITVSNNNPSAYSNFQVRDVINTQALISAGKMKADGGDIRYCDSLCNQLSYFVESGINTASTVIWVKVLSLPANGTRTIYMYYGNAAAASQSSGPNTFAYYEGFDNNTLGRFGTGPVCSSGTPNVSFNNGVASFSWTQSAMWLSDSSFAVSTVYTAEASVLSASGSFPGLHWARASGTQSMAILMGGGNVRISKAPISGTNNCVGHNFLQPTFSVSNPAGIWAFTWISTGSQAASFPNVGSWSTSDAELPRDQPLRIGIGGILTGAGNYSIDWVRARKYAPNSLVASNGLELSIPAGPGNSCSATALGAYSIRVNWNDYATNEDKYRIERSTNGGSNWSLKDSVPANVTQYTDTGLAPQTQYCYRVYAVNCFGISAYSNTACTTTTPIGIIKQSSEIPEKFELYQNFPNPFNPVTIIRFDLPSASFVKLVIFDVLGREISIAVNETLSAGTYDASLDASNCASGIYFYRIEAIQKDGTMFTKQMKMVILK